MSLAAYEGNILPRGSLRLAVPNANPIDAVTWRNAVLAVAISTPCEWVLNRSAVDGVRRWLLSKQCRFG